MALQYTLLVIIFLVSNFAPNDARFLPRDCGQAVSRQGRQASPTVVPILTPGGVGEVVGETLATNTLGTSSGFLPNLGFWADMASLVMGRSRTFSPYVRLSRGLLESQKCAEYVSCEASKFSRKYTTFKIFHTFLQDLPFEGDLADRMKAGSVMSTRGDDPFLCPSSFRCSPLEYLNSGVKTLSLLHDVASAAAL